MALERRALQQFDELHESGDLLWQENDPEYVDFEPFNFEFRVAPSLQEKPQNEDEGDSKPKSAFQDKDPLFSLGTYGPKHTHKLVLNKFSTVRPQFVLHTVEYEAQTDPLTLDDFAASTEALQQMGEKYMVIFNGGKDAGASVAHKHLQIIPKGKPIDEMQIEAVPRSILLQIAGMPYQHAIIPLPECPTGDFAYQEYLSMLKHLGSGPTEPHNILLTSAWMMVIPRRKAWIEEISANAASMVGMVWCKTEAQYQGWIRRGIETVLREMGVPRDPEAA